MDTVGFDRRKAVSIHATILQSFSCNGNLIAEVDRSQFQRNSKGDWLFLHGADLFNELLRMATAPSEELCISGMSALIRWSTDVIGVDVESGKVTLAGGERIESDLVVGMSKPKVDMKKSLIVYRSGWYQVHSASTGCWRSCIPYCSSFRLVCFLIYSSGRRNQRKSRQAAFNGSDTACRFVQSPCHG